MKVWKGTVDVGVASMMKDVSASFQKTSTVPALETPSPVVITSGTKVEGDSKKRETHEAQPLQTTPVATSIPQQWERGGLQFEFFREGGKLNIVDKSGSMVSVRTAKSSCTSEDVTVTPVGGVVGKFNIAEWNLIVDMSRAKAIMIELTADQMEFQIKL